MQFTENSHYKILSDLAKKPFDLTQKNGLNKKRISAFQTKGGPLTLLYATERIDKDVLEALFALAKHCQAVEKMRAMQSGQIVNCIHGHPSENRPALHTAMRDFFSDKNPGKQAFIASTFAAQEMQKLEAFLEKIDKRCFQSIVQIGIGGSDLGPKAIYYALQRYSQPEKKAFFISNVDPDDTTHVLQNLDLSKTLVVVVSKSGSTMETKTNELLARKIYEKQGLDPKKHFLSVTRQKSPMDNPQQYLASFYMQDYVGGRYSVTSMVGCVVLGFTLGMQNLKKFLEGACVMDKIACSSSSTSNLPLLGALLGIWNRNFLHYPSSAVIPYSQALHRFAAHLQQCDMESNGKSIDRQAKRVSFGTGPIVWGEPGTCAQHSFYQWIHQGTDIAPVEMLGFKQQQYEGQDMSVLGTTSQQKLLANLFAQSIALARGKPNDNPNQQFCGNRPSRILLAEKLTPYVMGSILSYYEHKVCFQGFIWDINSFDQEGVQLGKVLAEEILEAMQDPNKSSDEATLGYLQCLHNIT